MQEACVSNVPPIPDLLPKAHDQFARDMRPLNVNRLGPIAIFPSYLKNGLLQPRYTILTDNRLEFGWKLESNALETLSAVAIATEMEQNK
jgi:hypothetical protein